MSDAQRGVMSDVGLFARPSCGPIDKVANTDDAGSASAHGIRLFMVMMLAGWAACATAHTVKSATVPRDAIPSAPTEPSTSSSTESKPVSSSETSSDVASRESGCAADGRVWDGEHKGCLYEHGGCCYGSPESVCTAAGCPLDRCVIMELMPAQVRCAD